MTAQSAWGFSFIHEDTGLTNIGLTCRQISAANVLGDYWNETTTAFVASAPSYSDQKFSTAAEDSNAPGSYTATHGAFGTYTGRLRVVAHDEGDSNRAVATWIVESINGLPTVQTFADISDEIDAVSTTLGTVESKIDTVDDFVDTEITSIQASVNLIQAVTDKVDDTLEDDGGTYRFTTNALEQSPAGVDVSADVALIKAVTDKVDDTLENDGGVYRLTTNALEQAPTGGSSLTQADIRTAIGMASANLDSQLTNIDTNTSATLVDTGTTLPVTLAQIQLITDRLNDTLEDDGGVYRFTTNALEQGPAGASGLTQADVRTALGMSSANLDTQLASMTSTLNAVLVDTSITLQFSLDTIQATTDKLDDTLEDDGGVYRFTTNSLEQSPAASAGLTQADVRTALGMSSANLDTQLAGLPAGVYTEFTTGSNEDVFKADVSSISTLSQADIRSAVGLAAANLDTQLSTIDANVDMVVTDTSSTIPTTLSAISSFVDTEVAAIKAVTDKVDDTLEDDGGTYRFTTNALEQSPAVDVSADVAAIKAVTDKVDDTLEDDGGVYRLTTNALEQAPTGGVDVSADVAAIKAVTDKVDDTLEDDGGVYRFTTNALELAPDTVSSGALSIEQEPVPDGRTFLLVDRDDGLEGSTKLSAVAGESRIFATDFRNDLEDDRLATITSVDLETASSDILLTAVGVDHSQAKYRVAVDSAATAGEHTIIVTVTYSGTSQTVKGKCVLVVA